MDRTRRSRVEGPDQPVAIAATYPPSDRLVRTFTAASRPLEFLSVSSVSLWPNTSASSASPSRSQCALCTPGRRMMAAVHVKRPGTHPRVGGSEQVVSYVRGLIESGALHAGDRL